MDRRQTGHEAPSSDVSGQEQALSDAAFSGPPDEEQLRLLLAELDELTDRVQALAPDYEPPAFSPERLVTLIERLLSWYPKDVQLRILEKLQGALRRDLFNLDLWKGIWYMLSYTLRHNADLVRRHARGEIDTDPWGLDWELVDLVLPFFNFLYKTYFRVEIAGIDNIPIEGRALLVANHSGQLPWDGMMVGTAILNEHPAGRLARGLYAAILPGIPYVSTLLVRLGQTLATVENGTRLLEQDELVMVFPEGYKGTAKPFKDRYRLARFGRGGLCPDGPQYPVAHHSRVGRGLRGDLHLAGQAAHLFRDHRHSLPANYPQVSLVGSAGHRTAADQMVHRLRRANAGEQLWCRLG
jgi:hypothetical protein